VKRMTRTAQPSRTVIEAKRQRKIRSLKNVIAHATRQRDEAQAAIDQFAEELQELQQKKQG